MAIWPTTLPRPSASGYAVKPIDQSIRTDMEVGAARSRRRTTARNDKVSASWTMTDAQLAIFRTWFDDAAAGAAGGSAWFTVSLPIGTTGLVSVTARFTRAPEIAHIAGLNWSVTAELEVR